MSAILIMRDVSDVADPDMNLGFRFENTTGTPISAMTDLDNGQGVAGVYTIVYVASGATVNVTSDDGSKSPYALTGEVITADGATLHNDVIPGVALTFAAGSTGWTAISTRCPNDWPIYARGHMLRSERAGSMTKAIGAAKLAR